MGARSGWRVVRSRRRASRYVWGLAEFPLVLLDPPLVYTHAPLTTYSSCQIVVLFTHTTHDTRATRIARAQRLSMETGDRNFQVRFRYEVDKRTAGTCYEED